MQRENDIASQENKNIYSEEITRELKRSEEKFRGLLKAAPDATIIANEKGEIVLINRQIGSMTNDNRLCFI